MANEPKYANRANLERLYDNIKQREVQTFDTVAAMQAATYLEAGMTCHTNGNATVGDGGAAYYTVGTNGDIALQGGLYATEVNISLSNAVIDEITDDQTPSDVGFLDEAGLAHFWEKVTMKSDGGLGFESGATENDIYTILTIPKSLYEVSLELVTSFPSQSSTLKDYALREKPFLCMNINNSDSFLYDGTVYGVDAQQGVHGTHYALKDGETDFAMFGQGTTFASLASQGYTSAIGGWSYLRKEGVTNPDFDWTYDTFVRPNPRQTLAWDSDNWYIYTSYGRITFIGSSTSKNYMGKSMAQILAFCENRGWPNVAEFDGGGSIFVASGQPYRQLSMNLNDTFLRDAYMCVAFNAKEAS